MTGYWTYQHLTPQANGMPLGGGVTVAPRSPDGRVGAHVYHELVGGLEGGDGEPETNVTHGAIVDDTFAAFLRANGLGHHLDPLPAPDTAGYCPLDGEPDCRDLTEADRQVREALQVSPRGGLLGCSLVETEATGHPTSPRAQHLVHVAEKVSIDWRTSALVRVGAHTHRYREWFRPGEEPDPNLPSAPPKLREPEHLLRTPPSVRRWYAEQVAAGRIVDSERLPSPSVRRELREKSGLSRPAVASQLGVSKEALRLWETGEREPEGENREKYQTLLAEWHGATEEPPKGACGARAGRAAAPRPAAVPRHTARPRSTSDNTADTRPPGDDRGLRTATGTRPDRSPDGVILAR
jgi:hypothetical protein